MPHLSPHDLQAGMILADGVQNLDGKLLFAKDTQLDEKIIETLMMWGVERVAVEGADPETDALAATSIPQIIKQQAETVVQQRFKLVKSSHPAVVAIRELAVLELAKSSEATSSQS